MASDKEIIAKLLKIAENQQKIITKLAQSLPEAAPMGNDLAGHLDPAKTQKKSSKVLYDALPANVKGAVVHIEERGSDMLVGFKPDQKTQANYNVVLQTLQRLTNENVIQQAYNLKAV